MEICSVVQERVFRKVVVVLAASRNKIFERVLMDRLSGK